MIERGLESERTAPVKYAGADWLEEMRAEHDLPPLSPFGRIAADILGQVFLGIYHISDVVVGPNINWREDHVEVVLTCQELSTYDADVLTRLVLLAHDSCVRTSIVDNGRKRGLRLTLHNKKGRDGHMYERHPTMEEHVTALRNSMITDVRGASPATATCPAGITACSAHRAG